MVDPSARPDRMPTRPRGRRIWILLPVLVALVAGGLLGSGLTRAFGPRGVLRTPAGALSELQAEQRIEHAVRHFAAGLDATEEQQSKLAMLARSAMKDLWPLQQQARGARSRAIAVLTAPSVDRDALERIRAESVRLADAASKRVAQALADAADVLTPDQRRRMAERIAAREHRRGR